MQLAVIEFARNRAGLDGANSTEFDPETPHPVIALITEWMDADGRVERRDERSDLGGTMRLGAQPRGYRPGHAGASRSTRATSSANGTGIATKSTITICRASRRRASRSAARTKAESLCEMIELSDHPWFIGCQFHPEFTSTPRAGHPLFKSFVEAAVRLQTEQSTPAVAAA